MKFKKILSSIILTSAIFVGGCNIKLYQPDSSPNNQIQQQVPSPEEINKINPSSYSGNISYYQGNGTKLSSEEVYQKGLSSTVYILSTTTDAIYSGSGVVFSEDSTDDGYAYILTNAHVVENSIGIEIIYSNYKRDKAQLVGYHLLEDVAVLAVKKNDNYTIATLNPTDNLSPGSEVLAIGTPISTEYSFTATKGIISKIDSPITSTVDSSYELLLLQIDAPLNQGNSGGPLFDMYGNVIGINTMKLLYDDSYTSVDDFNFSIPIERAIFMANRFFTNKPYTRGLVGITIVDITDMPIATREDYDISLDYGLHVQEVSASSDAYGKIQKNDIITKINDVEFKVKTQFQKELYNHAKNDTVTLTVYRNNNYSTVEITLH